MLKQSRRVFLGTVEIAGFYGSLAAALRADGVDCSFVQLSPHPFNYAGPSPSEPRFLRWARGLAGLRLRLRQRAAPARQMAAVVYLVETLLRVFLVLPWAASRFEVFCFGFGSNIVGDLWGHWDVALLRLLGRRIVFTFHGADSRPPYLTGPHVRRLRAAARDWPRSLCTMTRARKRSLRAMERCAHVIVDIPARGHFHEKPFVDYSFLGSPCSAQDEESPSLARRAEGGRVRILHAPSDRAAKGSDGIARCIERLRARGHDIEYVELHGREHGEVVAELRRCDFVIDQLYADYPLAGFAAEAASQGKAAVVCGYLQDRERPAGMPTHYCHPEALEPAVARMIVDADYRAELGRRARAFVKTSWSAQIVARKWRRLFDGDIPDGWWFNPADTTYLHGGGISESQLRTVLRDLVRFGGPAALALDDKPEIRDRLARMAAAEPSLPFPDPPAACSPGQQAPDPRRESPARPDERTTS